MGRKRETKVKDWDQVTLRLPNGMRDELNRIALENDRSANAEIIHRLQQSLSPTDSPNLMALRECLRDELGKAIGATLSSKK